MYLAVKENKEINIQESEKEKFLNAGYDVVEVEKTNDGYKIKKKEQAPSKSVSYAEYKKVLDENKKLRAELSKLKKAAE